MFLFTVLFRSLSTDFVACKFVAGIVWFGGLHCEQTLFHIQALVSEGLDGGVQMSVASCRSVLGAEYKLLVNVPTFCSILLHNQGHFSAYFKSLLLPSLKCIYDLTCLGV